jgi:hypothetical protein
MLRMNELVEQALRERDYHIPIDQELIVAWCRYDASQNRPRTVIPIDGIRGLVTVRPDVKNRILSVDLCEIIRKTHESCARAQGYGASYMGRTVWDYEGYGLTGSESDGLARVVINRSIVEPIAEIAEIRSILQAAHKHMTIVANTSTALGTEIATIKFLHEHLPGCFDGILFPRNFSGDSKITKGHALKRLIETLDMPVDIIRVAHIDDAPHHNQAILEVLREYGVPTVQSTMPLFKPGRNAIRRNRVIIPSGVSTSTSIPEAFRRSAAFLRAKSKANVNA